jgi:hypothetical protein
MSEYSAPSAMPLMTHCKKIAMSISTPYARNLSCGGWQARGSRAVFWKEGRRPRRNAQDFTIFLLTLRESGGIITQ